MHPFQITYANLNDLPTLIPLFDAYRVFYRQPSNPGLARAFLHDRLSLRESVVLLARGNSDDHALGFTQLYPSFSSVAARRLWILNDLFVSVEARRQGVARALLRAAAHHATACGAIRLTLCTAADNQAAQALYESMGWIRDRDVFFQRPLTDSDC